MLYSNTALECTAEVIQSEVDPAWKVKVSLASSLLVDLV